MKIQKHIEVRLLKKRLNCPAIDVVQYDTGIQLVFSLVDFDIPAGTSATLYVQKRSGKFVYQEKNIAVSGNEITVDLENQALTEHGVTKYQIMLKNGTDTVTGFAGVFHIEESLASNNAARMMESKTVVSAFDEIVADHVAEFQTKAEQIVQACIATIPEDYTVMEAKVNELANAVKGNMSGAVVFADDVSTVEHNPIVKVHGKNLAPYGTITFTKNKSILLDNPLPEGTYTISAHITSNDTDSEYSAVSINNKSEVMKYIALKRGTRVSATFTVTKPITNIDFCAAYNYNQGETDSATWADIQIEKGTVATDYEPYIDPSTVTVKRCGKNLLSYPYTSSFGTADGITYSNAGNGRVSVSGTTTAGTNFFFAMHQILKAGTYTLSGAKHLIGMAILIYSKANSKAIATLNGGSESVTFTIDDDISDCDIYINYGYANGVVSGYVEPQIEVGEVATEFEAYKEETTHIPAANGTISGLTSVSPNMTILTDTEGAIVECEYNRDTNKVIEKLTNAIIALCGTV